MGESGTTSPAAADASSGCACLLESPLDVCGGEKDIDDDPYRLIAAGQALDVLLVQPGSSEQHERSCSDWIVRFPYHKGSENTVQVYINGNMHPDLSMVYRHKQSSCRFQTGNSTKPNQSALQNIFSQTDSSTSKSSDPLSILQVQYRLLDSGSNKCIGIATCDLYIYHSNFRMVVCDIDGTITKSNARGAFSTLIVKNYQNHVHEGVCEFMSHLTNQGGMGMVYLTSRPMDFVQSTRSFLHSLRQGKYTLPRGPLLMHPGNLSNVLFGELISFNMHEYKSDHLFRQVVLPFVAAGAKHSVMVMGFGNSRSDTIAYEMVGIPKSSIYMIDKRSEIKVFTVSADAGQSQIEQISHDLQEQRVQRANQLLHRVSRHRQTDSDMENLIMYRLGYCDPALFEAVKKQKEGRHPREPPARSNTCTF